MTATAAAEIKVEVGGGDITNVPVAWMFLTILLTFVIARTVTRYIRHSASKPHADDGTPGRGLIGDISLGGVHIHHQVFGIFIMVLAGMILVSAQPDGGALCVVAGLFGVGVGLVFDEFALWLHLKDVYWSDEGRHSVDAIFCVLAISGVLIGGANLVSGRPGSGSWWASVASLAVILVIAVICALKGKLITAVIGILIQPVAIIGAIRLAKPASGWARRRYTTRPKRMARAQKRFGPAYERRWNRVKDFIGGAPTAMTGMSNDRAASPGENAAEPATTPRRAAAPHPPAAFTQLPLPLDES